MTRALGLAMLAALFPSMADGQCRPGGPPNPAAQQKRIVGIVMNSSNEPLDNVEVVIRDPRRQARTNARGIFTLDDLANGTYELVVRRIGYEIVLQKYNVTDSGGVARVCLVPDPQGLAPMITSVPRGGLSGVIGDTAYQVVAGAEVRVMGEGLWTLTDSAGGFHLPLAKGTYPVLVTRKGYGKQLVSVRIPDDSGRKIAVWLGSPVRNPNTMSIALEGIRYRIMVTPAHRYSVVSAEDLARTDLSLAQAVQIAGKTSAPDDCEASIGGMGYSLPLYMLDKNDLIMLEVVTPPITRRAVTTMGGGRQPISGHRLTAPARCPAVIAWMKP